MTEDAEKLAEARRMLAAARRLERNMFDALVSAIHDGEDEDLVKVARRTLVMASAAVDEIEARIAGKAVTLQ